MRVRLVWGPKPRAPTKRPSERVPEPPVTTRQSIVNHCTLNAVEDPSKSGLNIFELFIIGNGCMTDDAGSPGMRAETAYRGGEKYELFYLILSRQKKFKKFKKWTFWTFFVLGPKFSLKVQKVHFLNFFYKKMSSPK